MLRIENTTPELNFENTTPELNFENTTPELNFEIKEYDEYYDIYRILLEWYGKKNIWDL